MCAVVKLGGGALAKRGGRAAVEISDNFVVKGDWRLTPKKIVKRMALVEFAMWCGSLIWCRVNLGTWYVRPSWRVEAYIAFPWSDSLKSQRETDVVEH
nr:hypothetical protein Iba_chr11bCG13430 [Ipomoea batatas]